MTDSEPKERLLSRKEVLETTGLSAKALTKFERARYVTAVTLDGHPHYTVESADLIKAMLLCQGRCANLNEAYEMAVQGMSLKKTRSGKAHSGKLKNRDPKKIKMHSRFKGLLDIDDDLAESLTASMVVGGYYESIPVVLAKWPDIKKPVLIDGHTRVRAAIKAGIQSVPCVIEYFDDEDGALQYMANAQTQRRPTDDWVLYQLISELDSVMDRGGDRRSEQAKSKRPQDPIETRHSTSAERTAALVGSSDTTVKRARRIRKEGTPEILEALKNRKMTISQAEKEIAAKAKTKTPVESPVKENQHAMVRLTDKNLEGLKELGGTLHSHVNVAVEQYIARRGWEDTEEQEESESDGQKPRLIQ